MKLEALETRSGYLPDTQYDMKPPMESPAVARCSRSGIVRYVASI